MAEHHGGTPPIKATVRRNGDRTLRSYPHCYGRVSKAQAADAWAEGLRKEISPTLLGARIPGRTRRVSAVVRPGSGDGLQGDDLRCSGMLRSITRSLGLIGESL